MGLLNKLFSKSVKNITEESTSTVTDFDGNVYHTIKIGNQIWMVENLKTSRYNDGKRINLVTLDFQWGIITKPAYCYYKNIEVNRDKYGCLYNWNAVSTGKLAPKGWHVPTDEEWTILENFLIANGYNYDNTITGNKIAKSLAAVTDWNSSSDSGAVGNNDYPDCRNKTGFTALPGGARNFIGGFYSIQYIGMWWSATEDSANEAWDRCINKSSQGVGKMATDKRSGASVRCVKD